MSHPTTLETEREATAKKTRTKHYGVLSTVSKHQNVKQFTATK